MLSTNYQSFTLDSVLDIQIQFMLSSKYQTFTLGSVLDLQIQYMPSTNYQTFTLGSVLDIQIWFMPSTNYQSFTLGSVLDIQFSICFQLTIRDPIKCFLVLIYTLINQSMPILRSFCLFSGAGVFFLYIYAISFFVGQVLILKCLKIFNKKIKIHLTSKQLLQLQSTNFVLHFFKTVAFTACQTTDEC